MAKIFSPYNYKPTDILRVTAQGMFVGKEKATSYRGYIIGEQSYILIMEKFFTIQAKFPCIEELELLLTNCYCDKDTIRLPDPEYERSSMFPGSWCVRVKDVDGNIGHFVCVTDDKESIAGCLSSVALRLTQNLEYRRLLIPVKPVKKQEITIDLSSGKEHIINIGNYKLRIIANACKNLCK